MSRVHKIMKWVIKQRTIGHSSVFIISFKRVLPKSLLVSVVHYFTLYVAFVPVLRQSDTTPFIYAQI